jgi:hypothetical protein
MLQAELTCKAFQYSKLTQKEYLEGMLDGFSLELHGSSDEASLWCPGFAHLRQGFKYFFYKNKIVSNNWIFLLKITVADPYL